MHAAFRWRSIIDRLPVGLDFSYQYAYALVLRGIRRVSKGSSPLRYSEKPH